jgi:hypothetical protein
MSKGVEAARAEVMRTATTAKDFILDDVVWFLFDLSSSEG